MSENTAFSLSCNCPLLTPDFNTTCRKFQEAGQDDPVNATYDYLDERMEEIYLVLEQEYFDLRGTDLYTDLYEFAYGDLIDIYNEKISLSYRLKARIEGEGITANDDYCDAMAKLNEILERYM